MKISELIQALKSVKDKYGDIGVYVLAFEEYDAVQDYFPASLEIIKGDKGRHAVYIKGDNKAMEFH